MQPQISPNLITAGDRNVTYPLAKGPEGSGYQSPISKDSKLGIVIIQEWWGLNKAIMSTCDHIASQGFSVLCPDIYRGKQAIDHETAGHLLQGLDWPDAVQVIGGAANFLLSTGCKKVGVMGFCMGGALTIAATCFWGKTFSASAPFYGIPDMSVWDLKGIECPLSLHFGELDELKGFSDPESAKVLEKNLKDAGKEVSLKIWEKAGHAFMNQDGPNYKKEVAEKALAEITVFMKKHLE